MDLALTTAADANNPDEHDLLLVDGDLVWLPSGGLEAIAQHLRVRLQHLLGEWFLDTREGVPFFTEVYVKNPYLPRVASIFRRVILTTPGVLSLTVFTYSFDVSARHFTLDFEATLSDGRIFSSADYGPFLVEVL